MLLSANATETDLRGFDVLFFAAHVLREPTLVLSAPDHATAAQRRGEYRLIERLTDAMAIRSAAAKRVATRLWFIAPRRRQHSRAGFSYFAMRQGKLPSEKSCHRAPMRRLRPVRSNPRVRGMHNPSIMTAAQGQTDG